MYDLSFPRKAPLILFLIISVLSCFFHSPFVLGSTTHTISHDIVGDEVFSGANDIYLIDGPILVTGSLTFSPGVVVAFSGEANITLIGSTLSMLGTFQEYIQIQSLNESSQPRIVADATSSIFLEYVSVVDPGVKLIKALGAMVTVRHSKFSDASEYTIQTQFSTDVTIESNMIQSINSTVNPVISISQANNTLSSSISIISNQFSSSGTPLLNIYTRGESSIVMHNNSFTAGSQGARIDADYGTLKIYNNYFKGLSDPLKITTFASSSSEAYIQDNVFDSCQGPLSVKKTDGLFFILRNTFNASDADCLLSFENSFFCESQMLIQDNIFSDNIISNQVISLKYPTYCRLSDFRSNTITNNLLLPTFQNLVSVSGAVKLNRNTFQLSNNTLVNSGTIVVDAQFNSWGTSDASLIRSIAGNSSPILKNFKTLYTPFIDLGGDVIEDDLFNSTEKDSLVDCKSVRNLWSKAPSAVYRINPYCTSMLVPCQMTGSEGIILQKRRFGDVDFNVDWTTYENGFGDLDGDLFLGLKNLQLFTRTSMDVISETWGSSNQRSYTGYISIGTSSTDYALTGYLNYETYTAVPFGTFDHYSTQQTLDCATQQTSGWWFTNCSSPLSWNLNGPFYENGASGIYIGEDNNLRYASLRLLSATQNRDLMVCKPITCFSLNQGDLNVCSGHGQCVGMDECTCFSGYYGRTCNISVVVNSTMTTPTKYCEDAIFSVYVYGLQGNFTYKWSVSFSGDLKPGIYPYLAAQKGSSITLPAIYLGLAYNLFLVEVFNGGMKVGESLNSVAMPPFVIDSSNLYIRETATIVIRQYETYSLVMKSINLPVCADTENKSWYFDGTSYRILSNNLTVDIVATQTRNLYASLSFQGIQVELNIPMVVIPSIPVAMITGGSRMVTSFHNHTIDASRSYDYAVKNSTPIFMWSCGGCKNFVATNNSKFLFNEDVGIYPISLVYYSDPKNPSRTAKAEVVLTVVDDLSDMPIPEIITILPNILDTRYKLRLEPSVSKNRPNHMMEYQWIIERKEANESVIIAGRSYNVVPLALPEDYLKANSTYVFTLRVRYTNFTNNGVVSVTGRTASAPIIQTAGCSPCNGTALETQFSLSASATDESEYYPLDYVFSYYDSLSQRFIPLQSPSYTSRIQTILPLLSTSTITIQATVTNNYGVASFSRFNISLVESSNSSSVLQSLISIMNNQSSVDVLTVVASSFNKLQAHNQSTEMVEAVLSFVSNSLDRDTTQNTSLSANVATISINALESLTEFNTYDNRSTITLTKNSHLLVDKLIDLCTQGKLELRDSTTNSLARSVSNLLTKYQEEEPLLNNPMIATISKVSTWLANSKLISENQTSITTETYQLSVKKEKGFTIGGTTVSTGDIQVNVPRNISLLSSEQEYVVQSISFNQTFNPYKFTSRQNFSTPIVDFEIKQGETKVKLSNMDYPLEIVLNKEIEKENSSFRYECRFMDESTNSSWFTEGCWLYEEGESSIICHCTHTTSFSAMIIYDPAAPNKASDGLYITSIIINSLLAVISVALLIITFLWRKKQPVKSRFLAPYIGLGAIVVECILNGIIRNSLLIAANNARDYRGINSIAYLILTIVNPLVILSLFIYFWQMLRYFFLKNLYAIMDIEKRNLKKIRFLKMLSSQLLYVILGSLVVVAVCTYFVVISILEATNVIKPNAASTVNALSFSVMSLFLGALIVVTFIWDCTVILSRKLWRRDRKMDEGNADLAYFNKIFSTMVNHFKSDDPLMFRIESIFMVCAIFVMTVSYIVGITDRFDSRASPNSAAKIIEFLFDIMYLSLRIMAFGGLATLVRLVQRTKLHREHEDYATLKQYMSELKTGTSTIESQLQNLLRDEYGYLAISTYAKKEFALENIILWKRLEDVRSDNITASEDKRKKMLQDLYDDCIANGSPYECNIPSKVKKNYRALLGRADDVSAADAEEMFLNVSNELLVNICDTFTRFSVSPEYAQFMTVRAMSKELGDVGLLKME